MGSLTPNCDAFSPSIAVVREDLRVYALALLRTQRKDVSDHMERFIQDLIPTEYTAPSFREYVRDGIDHDRKRLLWGEVRRVRKIFSLRS